MSIIQRGINQILYTSAVAAGAARRSIDAAKEAHAEEKRVAALEKAVEPQKDAAGRIKTPRAGTAAGKTNLATNKELNKIYEQRYFQNPTPENKEKWEKSSQTVATIEERAKRANARAVEKIRAKIIQSEERRKFAAAVKGYNEKEAFEALTPAEQSKFIEFRKRPEAQEIVAKLPLSYQIAAYKQFSGEGKK